MEGDETWMTVTMEVGLWKYSSLKIVKGRKATSFYKSSGDI